MAKPTILYGRQVLVEALQAGLRPQRVFIESRQAKQWLTELDLRSIPVEQGIPGQVKNQNHQGVAFELQHDFYLSSWPKEAGERYPFVVLCNHLQDVQNLGSIARAAVAFGAGVVIHESRRSASLTPAAIRASAGLAFRLKFWEVSNTANFLIKLEQQGYFRAGLDARGEDSLPIYRWEPQFPLALVIGSEGDGIGHSVLKRLDQKLSIPMEEGVDSLNASQAATIAMSWVHGFCSATKA